MQLALRTPFEGSDQLDTRVIICTHTSTPSPDHVSGHAEGLSQFIDKVTAYLVRQKDRGSPRRIKQIYVEPARQFSVRGRDRYQFQWKALLELCSKEEADYYVVGAGTIIIAENLLSALCLASTPTFSRRVDELANSFEDWTMPKRLPTVFAGLTTDIQGKIYVSNHFITAPFEWYN